MTFQGKTHVSSTGSCQVHRQRFLVRVTVEDRTVVLVELLERLAIVRGEHKNPIVTFGARVAAIVQHDAAKRRWLLKVYLPPRIILVLSVKPPFAGSHTVHAASGVLFRLDVPAASRLSARLAHPQLVLVKPIGFDLLGR